MTVQLEATQISPVDVEGRKNLGLRAGDTVRVHQKIQEKGKTRIQVFEGLVLTRKHGNEPGGTFTVRATMSGVGVEKVFPLFSPLIDKIEVIRRSKVRRAKLYYIRDKVAREIRRQLRNMKLVTLTTESERELGERKEQEAKDAEEKAAAEAAEKEAAEKAAEEATQAEEAPEETPAPAEEAEKESEEQEPEEEKPSEEEEKKEA